MSKLNLALIALLLVGVWVVACGDETPTTPTPTPPANHAPGAPTIDTARGAPADASTNQAVTSQVYWKCVDPDGDALKFDVFFGTDANPPSVATDQSADGHNPGTLAFSTKYYWKVVAKDPDGETTASPVWSFTTMAQAAETVSTPDAPTGPTAGVTGQSLDYDTGNAVSSHGHSVEYRYDWGDGNMSAWQAVTAASYGWANAGTFTVKAQARCATHTGVESAWSAGTDATITEAVETVSVPGNVDGPTTAEVGHGAAYRLLDTATSSLGHSVEYRFDWGDGNMSVWGPTLNTSYAFPTAGSFDIKGQARCRTHTTVESAWTPALTVTVSEPTETIGTPSLIYPPPSGGVGEEISFWSNYGTSSEGHATEYRYDFGDGTISAWAPTQAGAHTWAAAGTYEVKSQARCATHTTAESNWSTPASIEIVDSEIISTPTVNPAPETTINRDVLTYIQMSATSNFGHQVQYFVDWGDGNTSDWTTSIQRSHSWNALGDYDMRVKARCVDHTAIESEWSATTVVHVVEAISKPVLNTPAPAPKNTPVTFTTSGSVSDEGHALEYRLWTSMYYYQGWQYGEWTTIDNLVHTFPSARVWYARVQARCIVHLTESQPSGYVPVTITE